jgi:4-diphosphocytidyl-2-C-methyl-D-erythritol kinase
VPVTQPWRNLPELVTALVRRGNDLSDAAISLRPPIAEVLTFLHNSRGARYAAMSGSGATCFALYDSLDAAQRASASMPPAWWRHAGALI